MCNSKTVVRTIQVPRPTRAVTPTKIQKPIPVSIPAKKETVTK